MRDPMPFLLSRLAEDDVVINDLVDQVQTLPLGGQPLSLSWSSLSIDLARLLESTGS